MEGVRIIICFKDDQDRDTAATGKLVVNIYDDPHNDYNFKLIASKTFNISQSDFKDTDYGLWNAYMVTLPRITFTSTKSSSKYGKANVFLTSVKGTIIQGEGQVEFY